MDGQGRGKLGMSSMGELSRLSNHDTSQDIGYYESQTELATWINIDLVGLTCVDMFSIM